MIFKRFQRTSPLETGLGKLRDRLGLDNPGSTSEPTQSVPVTVYPTADQSRSIVYSPDLDGQAEPGEVVWFWVPTSSHDEKAFERPMLIIGRTLNHNLMGLLISSNADHAGTKNWMSIGTGQWDTSGKPGWIRLDRTIVIPESAVRRRGAMFPQTRFDRIATALRTRYDWT